MSVGVDLFLTDCYSFLQSLSLEHFVEWSEDTPFQLTLVC